VLHGGIASVRVGTAGDGAAPEPADEQAASAAATLRAIVTAIPGDTARRRTPSSVGRIIGSCSVS
jgi:hypothetical protein